MQATAVNQTRAGNHVRVLVAGLGNELLQDDGVGIHAVRLVQAQLTPREKRGVVVAEVGVFVLDAQHLFEWADHIIAVDAMHGGKVPGTIYRAQVSDIDEPIVPGGLHELSLVGALRLLRGVRPAITILGVEPEVIDYGMELTPTLKAVLPRVAEETVKFARACSQKVFSTV